MNWLNRAFSVKERRRERVEIRVYYTLMNKRVYRKFMLRVVIESMMRDFPEETREVLEEFGSSLTVS